MPNSKDAAGRSKRIRLLGIGDIVREAEHTVGMIEKLVESRVLGADPARHEMRRLRDDLRELASATRTALETGVDKHADGETTPARKTRA